MRYLDICSGISAPTAAWKPLGWECAAYSEIEPFPRAVLAHHYPDTPLHGDFTTIGANDYGSIDLLVGGTPCQSFSVAGLRGGLADDRGNLALEYLRLADRTRPRWLVWENVPGVLSSNGGRDFGAILGGMGELGYGFAYRVLDAQHFGVPQRRRRVFVVGHLGEWRRAAAVLFERHGLQGHPAPRRETGEGIAPTISARPTGGGGLGTDFDCDGGLIAGTLGHGGKSAGSATTQDALCGNLIAHCLNGHGGPHGRLDAESETFVAHSLRGEGFDASKDGTGRGTPLVPVCFSAKDHGADTGDIAPTLRSGSHSGSHANGGVMPAVAFGISSDAIDRSGEGDGSPGQRAGLGIVADAAPCIRARPTNSVAYASAVRRLTPRECERLQGFPDDFTLVPYRNKLAADGPRYKALGNSMAVPVVRWIGERIEAVEALSAMRAAT